MNLGFENIGLAFLLTTIAGLSTGIGSAIAYFIKKPKMQYLSFSLGFSAGVMVYISVDEILPCPPICTRSYSRLRHSIRHAHHGIKFIPLIKNQ